MLDWFHHYSPTAIMITVGSVKLYWYGLILVGAMVAGIITSSRLAEKFSVTREAIYDLGFWLIIWGIVGARLYHVGLEWPYYSQNLWDILKIWQGGLAIHGGVIAGVVTLIIFAKRRALSFWSLAGAVAPGLVLAQAIGRWGNYFNQELFGRPTDLPWGIYIEPLRRGLDYATNTYFHPTFLYESLSGLILFAWLIILIKRFDRPSYPFRFDVERQGKIVVAWFLLIFGLYRFLVEFIKIDTTPILFNLRWPQIISLIAMFIGAIILVKVKFSIPKSDSE